VDGFLEWHPDIGPLVADGYRYIGLPEAATAFERLWNSPLVARLLLNEDYIPSTEELSKLDQLGNAVGSHDGTRISFVRRHIGSFLG
jgi:hypothetical protein